MITLADLPSAGIVDGLAFKVMDPTTTADDCIVVGVGEEVAGDMNFFSTVSYTAPPSVVKYRWDGVSVFCIEVVVVAGVATALMLNISLISERCFCWIKTGQRFFVINFIKRIPIVTCGFKFRSG